METKSGIRSTEFWLTLLGNVGALAATVAGALPAKYAAAAMTVSGAAYVISRGIAKLGGLLPGFLSK